VRNLYNFDVIYIIVKGEERVKKGYNPYDIYFIDINQKLELPSNNLDFLFLWRYTIYPNIIINVITNFS